MKDRKTIAWIYHNSKTQRISLLVLILANALFAGCGILFALAAKGVIDGAAAGERDTLILQGLGLFAVIVLQLILRILCRSLVVRIQGQLEIIYKHKLLGEVLKKDPTVTSGYHSGELMNRLTGDSIVVSEGVTDIVPELAALLTKVVGALAVLCVFDLTFTLVFAVGGLTLFLTTKYFRKKLKHLHKNVQEKDGLLRSLMQELLENLIVIKIFGAETVMERKAAERSQEHYRAKIRKNTVGILANAGFTFIFSIGYLYALVWGAFGLLAQTISFGTIIAILQLVGQVQTPFAALSGLLPKAYGVIASAERLIELENLPDEVNRNKEDLHVPAVYARLHRIQMRDVSFRYDRDMVLDHVGLIIEKGDFAVISGRSGIGKSTLIMLLLGIFTATDGTIGIELNTGETLPVDNCTRKLFAYVPQNNLLLSGTIRENIAFNNMTASDNAIMAAAEVGCAAEFIRSLPCGLDTVIGEKGLGLSQGQAQRLAVARAVMCGAPILLLDEATSALDEKTEKKLLDNIKSDDGQNLHYHQP